MGSICMMLVRTLLYVTLFNFVGTVTGRKSVAYGSKNRIPVILVHNFSSSKNRIFKVLSP